MKEYTIEGITFRQFCNRVRKVSDLKYSPTRDELYREWCLNGAVNYTLSVARIKARRMVVECLHCGEPWSKQNKPATCPECGTSGCTMCVKMTETETCCLAPE